MTPDFGGYSEFETTQIVAQKTTHNKNNPCHACLALLV